MSNYLYQYENHSDVMTTPPTIKNYVIFDDINTDNPHVHYYTDIVNGIEFIDLGLPSGNLWAKHNIGAVDEYDIGLYFQWGDTKGYRKGDYNFSWSNYKFGTESNVTKYNSTDKKTTLELIDDAAHINCKGNWEIPNRTNFNELTNSSYTTIQYVENYNDKNVNGYLITSLINGKQLFLIATNAIVNNSWNSAATTCCLDACVKYSNTHRYNFIIYSNLTFKTGDTSRKILGIPIRPIVRNKVFLTNS